MTPETILLSKIMLTVGIVASVGTVILTLVNLMRLTRKVCREREEP